jgi:hypothetical protein
MADPISIAVACLAVASITRRIGVTWPARIATVVPLVLVSPSDCRGRATADGACLHCQA